MYVTSAPTPFTPARLIRKVVIGLLAAALLAPIADRIQGVGPDVLDNGRQAATTWINNFHTAEAQQGELFRGVVQP
jgi:hypothetical protein